MAGIVRTGAAPLATGGAHGVEERSHELVPDPPYYFPANRATIHRAPKQPLVLPPPSRLELTGPAIGSDTVKASDSDLTAQGGAAPLGQRIIVHGRLTDSWGRPIVGRLVEVWQANAAGRYTHNSDRWDAPLDPNFFGAGRCITDEQGGYRFLTIKPGPYPFRNHANAWRPAHIHFSVFGRSISQRFVTQMYVPDDGLHFQDPIFNSIRDERARLRLVAQYDHGSTLPEYAPAYRFDMVLGGPDETMWER